MRKKSKILPHFLIGCIAGAAGTALYLYLRDLLQIPQPGWIAAILTLFLAVFVVILAHELGHLIAGRAVGFTFYMLTVGPFKIQKTGGKVRPGINRHLNPGGGLTLMMPPEPDPELSKLFWFIAGGPIASLVLGIIAISIPVLFADSAETQAHGFILYVLFTTGFISILICFLSVIPSNEAGLESDGSQIFDLYRGGEKSIIKQQLMSLSATIMNGTRPGEIEKKILDSLLAKAGSEINSYTLTARLIAVYYHLDRGDIDEAENYLDSLIENLEKRGNPLLEGTVFIEKAFVRAAYRKDPETADVYLKKGRDRSLEDHILARADSSYLIASGNIEAGIIRAKEGLQVADHSISKGSIVFEREILTLLSKGHLPDADHF